MPFLQWLKRDTTHPLRPYYKHTEDWCGIQIDASEVAIDLLVSAGYAPDDSDQAGQPIEEDTQTLLMLAFSRAPHLMRHVQGLVHQEGS